MTTYAIIKTGGKQFKVGVGDVIDVELLKEELGAQVKFQEVLFVHNGAEALVGKPNVAGYVVKAELVDAVLGPKVIAYKYKRRKRQSVKRGHRQQYSRVKITDIAASKA